LHWADDSCSHELSSQKVLQNFLQVHVNLSVTKLRWLSSAVVTENSGLSGSVSSGKDFLTQLHQYSYGKLQLNWGRLLRAVTDEL
jgi:hypothetical protein